jgi:hypothetical protein
MSNKRTQLMTDAEAAADQMIADLNKPSVVEIVEADDIDGAQPDAGLTQVDEGTPSTDAGAQPLDTPPVDSAPAGPELAALQAQVTELSEKLDKADQRYRTLQGMFDARNQDNETLRTIIANFGSQPAAPTAPVSAVSEEDKKEFGEDLIDLIIRIVKEQVAPMLADVDTRVRSVATVATKTAADKFDEDLAGLVPDWDVINTSPEFIAWLGTYKAQALNAAYHAYDLDGTAQFFLDFKKLTAPEPAPATNVVEIVPAPAAPATDKLAHLAAPTKGKVTPIQAPVNGKIWTGADVTKLYQDHAAKRISNAEFATLEADLFEAQRTGRIAA